MSIKCATVLGPYSKRGRVYGFLLCLCDQLALPVVLALCVLVCALPHKGGKTVLYKLYFPTLVKYIFHHPGTTLGKKNPLLGILNLQLEVKYPKGTDNSQDIVLPCQNSHFSATARYLLDLFPDITKGISSDLYTWPLSEEIKCVCILCIAACRYPSVK